MPGPALPHAPSSGGSTSETYTFVFAPHAAQIAFYLLAIGILTVLAWRSLRGGLYCWCGREKQGCPHQPFDEEPTE